jgi:hypothetical protein
MPMPRESSRIAGVSMDPLHMERPAEVPISNYFLVLEIQNFLLHEKFGVVGFSKERPKFNIQLRPGVVQFMEFCMANFGVVFWSTEVDERMEAQYDRLMRAYSSLAQNPNRPKFARHWCDMSTSINPRTGKANIALKRLSHLFDDTRALGSTHANKDNSLLIDPYSRTCVLNDPYNGFHLNLFAWNSENGETGPGMPSRTILEENYRPDDREGRPEVRTRPRLPRGRVFTVRRRGKNRVRADAKIK